MRLSIFPALALLSVLVASCAAGPSTTIRGGRTVAPPCSATLTAIPGLAVAARLEVVAGGSARVGVRYGTPGTPAETHALLVPPAGRLVSTLLGLAPGATSRADVEVRYGDGSTCSCAGLTVTTPPLEPVVPARLDVTVNRGVTGDRLLLSMNQDAEGGPTVLIDRSGRVLWYVRSGGKAFAFVPHGRLVVHDKHAEAFQEIALDGTVVRTLRDPNSAAGTDGHDFQLLPDGGALLFGAETHSVDSRTWAPEGGIANATRWDDTVTEVAPDGTARFRWSSWKHIAESEITRDASDPIDPKDYEVVHANAIEPFPDGTFVLSLRNTSSLVKIERANGSVVWRLGGTRSDFRIQGDPLGGFSRQHDAHRTAGDRILLFDNGNAHDPPESRVVEYRLDEGAKVATMVWQWRRTPPVFAPVSGSVERFPNGHTLIAWGPKQLVTEVDAEGAVAWEAVPRGYGVYRARQVPPGWEDDLR